MADQGELTTMHPPGNNGTESGKGTIVYENATHEFITPTANHNKPLVINKPVTFTLVEGKVTSVIQN